MKRLADDSSSGSSGCSGRSGRSGRRGGGGGGGVLVKVTLMCCSWSQLLHLVRRMTSVELVKRSSEVFLTANVRTSLCWSLWSR